MISYSIGGLLILWLLYDLYSGKVYLHRAYLFKEEPVGYFFVMLLWFAIAASFFIWPYW